MKKIAAGGNYTVALKSDGTVAAWGDNFDGQLNVPPGNNYVAVAVGWSHTVALKSDGTLAAWGLNADGQCNVPLGNNYVAVAAGDFHSVALKSDGTLAAWGDNNCYQCDVPDGNNYVAVAAGEYHNVALKSDGTLAAWGWNVVGACNVPPGNNYVAVAAGDLHSVALKSDGTLAAWGANGDGQCNVPPGNNYVAEAAGYAHNVALKSDGTLVAWGWNADGQCNVPAGKNYVAVAAGAYHSVALKSDGTLAAWGLNRRGQCNVPAGLDLILPDAPDRPTAAAGPDINLAEKMAGVNVVVPLGASKAIAGYTVELLIDGVSFGTPVSHVLTAAGITAGSCTVTIPATAGGGWAIDGSKAITARIIDGTEAGPVSQTLTLNLDATLPTVTLSTTAVNPTNQSIIPVTITFSEAVFGFESGDIIVTNGTASDFSGSGATYTVKITPSGQGAVTIGVAGDVAQDAAGNGNTAATPLSRTYDSQAPTVAITSTAGNATNQPIIPVTITFSEPVTGFTIDDINVGNGSKSNFTVIDGSNYTVNINPSGQGTVTVDIAANAARDAVGNPNLPAAQLSFVFDSLASTGSLSINDGTTFTNDEEVTLNITADGTGSGIAQMRFSNDNQNWSVWEAFASAKNWTLSAGSGGTCTVYAEVRDAAGNTGLFSDTIIIKAHAPVFTPVNGTFNAPFYINITSATTGAEIRYTTDGSEPTETSALYDGLTIKISSNTTITAKSFKTGWTQSDPVSAAYTINSATIICQPGNSDPQTSPNKLLTAQNFEGDLSVQYNTASLWLGKGKTGKLSDIWLYYPQLIVSENGQIPSDAKIVSAQLALTVKGFTGNAYHPYKINLYRITDPDAKGTPYFGGDGIRNGLDYQYRDHRPGMNIPWKTGAANIRAILDSNNLVDTYEVIPAVFQEQGYTMIRLDVTESLQSWLSGSANQGWFLSGDQAADWAFNDGVEFYGIGDPTVANRPKLVVTYVSASGNNNRPASITGLSATPGNNQVELKWTNPSGINGVLILRKAGVIPADPTDGTVVFDGSAAAKIDNQGLTNDNTYYYAIFAYDNLRNYSKKVWVKAIPTAGAGVPGTPTQLSAGTSGDNLTFSWTYVPGVEKWFQLEQQEEGTSGSWAKVATMASDHSGNGSLTVNLNDPNFNLKPNTGYNYRLSAVNDHGASGYAVTSSTLTTPAFLQAPADLTWAIISAGRVDLSWTNQATDVTGYKVTVCDADQNELWSYSLAANATTCSVRGLNPGTKYLIKVTAIKGAEEAAAWTEPITTTIDFKGGLL